MKILITGAKGFIGSNLVERLKGNELILVDIANYHYGYYMPKDLDFVIHLGAITDTTETDVDKLKKFNLEYSIDLWDLCTKYQIPFIYASSAATYGSSDVFDDRTHPNDLKPINQYAVSKNEFDKYVIKLSKTIDPYAQIHQPPFWAGLKFFNVYGIGEHNKGKMASYIYQSYNQILEKGEVDLFQFGEQKRDFVYVDDVCDVICWMIENKPKSDIYNVGTGFARSFNDMVRCVYYSMKRNKINILYKEIPENIIDKYQSFTEANISKLIDAGYKKKFLNLEQGIEKYINKLNK